MEGKRLEGRLHEYWKAAINKLRIDINTLARAGFTKDQTLMLIDDPLVYISQYMDYLARQDKKPLTDKERAQIAELLDEIESSLPEAGRDNKEAEKC